MTQLNRFPKFLTIVRSDGTKEKDWRWGEAITEGNRRLVRVYKKVGKQLLVKTVDVFRLMEWNGMSLRGASATLDGTGRFLSAGALDPGQY